MADRHRLTIRSIDPDPRGAAIRSAAAHLGIELPAPVQVADVIHVSGALDDDQRTRLAAAVADPLLQVASWDAPSSHGIEVTLLPGVTDTAADAVLHAADQLGIDLTSAATGRRIEFGRTSIPITPTTSSAGWSPTR